MTHNNTAAKAGRMGINPNPTTDNIIAITLKSNPGTKRRREPSLEDFCFNSVFSISY